MNSMNLQLGPIADAVSSAIAAAEEQQVVKRIWRKDASLWKTDSTAQENIRSSLGWLTVSDEMIGVAEELAEYGEFIRQRGFRHAMVCGMGGSSLCPEVLRRSFPQRDGFPELVVLDSTDPDTIGDLAHQLDIEKGLFIVASKSGSTIEPTVFYKFWYDYLKKRVSNPGDNFLAITDPGSPLVETAAELNFRRVILNQKDIGGRFSALSYFGVVPAALAGIDIRKLLERAKSVSQMCAPAMPLEQNPGLQLGVILSECVQAGRDKLTLIIEDRIASLGLWIEQLVAESTGKEGKGIVPVAGEPLGDPSLYGSDRLFVSISVGAPGSNVKQKLDALSAAGHPVVYRTLRDTYDLAAEFFVWEFATACAGWRMAINPFDQPDVQVAKLATNEVLRAFEKDHRLPKHKVIATDELFSIFVDDDDSRGINDGSVETVLRSHFNTIRPGDYLAVLAFIEQTPEVDGLMQQLQVLLRDKTRCASTTGYGPRYLHSTGQLHKGGPDKGLFLQITASDEIDFDVPGEQYSFSILKQAQAFGDFRALSRRGRRVLGIDIHDKGVKALKRLLELITR